MDRLSTTLCQLADALCAGPPLKWLLKPPALGERTHRGAFVEWEFRNAALSWNYFSPYDRLEGKTVLDVGCAHGGKSTYYALHGARRVTAIDRDEARIEEAQAFASQKGACNISFETQDAKTLPYAAETFDLVVFNDSIEHLEEPAASLHDAYRVLKRGGTVNIAFPPYGSPWGAHLFAYIRIPWAQFLFPEETLVRLWKARYQAEKGKAPVASGEGMEDIAAAGTIAELSHLNRMTIRRFKDMVAETPFEVLFWRLRTMGNLFGFATRRGGLQEHLVTRLVAVLRKSGKQDVLPGPVSFRF